MVRPIKIIKEQEITIRKQRDIQVEFSYLESNTEPEWIIHYYVAATVDIIHVLHKYNNTHCMANVPEDSEVKKNPEQTKL